MQTRYEATMPIEVRRRWGPGLFIALGLVMAVVGVWILLDPAMLSNVPRPRSVWAGIAGVVGGACAIGVGVRGELSVRRRR